MKLTGAAILVSRDMKVLQAAPAAYPYRSAEEGFAMDLEPLPGTLKNYVFENAFLNIRPAVVYDIDLPMRQFEFEGEVQDTLVRLSRIRFNLADWRDLAHHEFRFPVNPTVGYIDGSMYLGSAHNPADVTRITFGTLTGKQLPAEIDISFDFEYEGLSALGKPSFTWQVVLNVDPAALDEVSAAFNQ